MRKIAIALAGVLAAVGMTLVASPAASADPTDTARGWTQKAYEPVAHPMANTGTCPAITKIHSAALVNPAKTVELYETQAACLSGTAVPVAVLTAATMADSGTDATGAETKLGDLGATSYQIK